MGLLFLSAVVLLNLPLHSQEVFQFSKNPDTFVFEVSSLMKSKNLNIYDGSMIIVAELDTVWNKSRYNDGEKAIIMDIAQKMVEKKMLNNIEFHHFLSIVNQVPYTFADHASMYNFLIYTSDILDSNDSKAFKNCIEYSYLFLYKDILNKFTNIKWYLRDAVFRFPEKTEFALSVDAGTLVCASANDSLIIEKTSGVFSKNEMSWIGKGGLTSWKCFDIDDNKVYAELSDYSIDMRKGDYSADNVSLYNLFSSKEPLVGNLQDKVIGIKRDGKSKYPIFKSYCENDVSDIFENINLIGSAGMLGFDMCTFANSSNYAIMTINNGDAVHAKFMSKSFLICDDKLKSDNASLVIYIDNDSIFHSGLSLLYDDKTRELMLYNMNRHMGNGPFCDTYHNINIFSEAMLWNLDDNKIRFHKVLSQFADSRAYLKSMNFYRKSDWDRLKGIDDYSPLTLVNDYLKKFDTEVIDLNFFANHLKRNIEQIVSMVMRLVEQGYMTYDYQNMLAYPTESFYQTINARYGKIDYDVIRLDSYTTGNQPNMVLDFTNNDLIVNGVGNVIVSDAKNVVINPYDKSVIVKKNLDMEFSGKMMAGLFEFHTHSSYFDYSDFVIELPTIDSLVLYVKANESESNVAEYVRVKNAISNVSGKIYIDDNKNKSGLVNNANYPIFDCEKDSQIFFDKTSFILPPFKIDSLFTFSTSEFNLRGTVRSGVFMDFEEELVVKDDYSLGFSHKIGKEGLKIVNSDAKFNNEVRLSTEVFYGIGTLSFMTAFAESRNVTFDDSVAYMKGRFEMLAINDTISVPFAFVDSASIRMVTNDNMMFVSTLDEDIELYDNCSFEGEVCLKYDGFFGKGILKMDGVTVKSDNFVLKHNSFEADSAYIVIYDDKGGENLIASNYLFSVDFDNNTGIFKSVNENGNIVFPKNSVMCGLDNAKWVMGSETISLSSKHHKNVLPTDADAEIPSFGALNMDYNFAKQTILAQGIDSLRIADALVSLSDGYLMINEKANIQSVGSATIHVGDSHTIYDAQIEILGKDNYVAKGYLDYVDPEKHVSPLYFNEIFPDSTGITKGSMIINESDNFLVNRDYLFKGVVSFESDIEPLSFEGDFMMINPCLNDYQWFNSRIDAVSKNVALPLNKDDSAPQCGLYYDESNKEYFAEFFTDNPVYNPDRTVLSYSDELYYDSDFHGFVNSEIFFKPDSCYIAGVGEMDLGFNTPYMCFLTEGEFVYDIPNDEIRLESMAMLDFTFDDALVDYIVFSMFGYDTKDFFEVKCKKEMCIIMDDLKMKWVNSLHCFVSEPEVYISSINNFIIGDNYETAVLIDYNDVPTYMFYLKVDEENWLFVKYCDGKTEVLSADAKFNNYLEAIKYSNRSFVDKDKKKAYEYAVAQSADVNNLLNKLKYIRGK